MSPWMREKVWKIWEMREGSGKREDGEYDVSLALMKVKKYA
jgi:hypothetical protein